MKKDIHELETGFDGIDLLSDYLLHEDWHPVLAGTSKQAARVQVETILYEYSPKYRKEIGRPMGIFERLGKMFGKEH